MAKTFNIGIDLGTTNSLIGRYLDGKVELFKNPINWKNTLPSVVAFRKERTIVGDKARELIGRDGKNVCSHFKRKMGTAEVYDIPNLGESRSPIELSAQVLKELKNFVMDGSDLSAAVITIPASFDTIQSNATKKAGYLAGFSEVALLQEPIAASLAFANALDSESLEGKWLVYDLGGGTFDVALVELVDGDMRVLDNEGDNYLGGVDFDRLILEHILLPNLDNRGTFSNLRAQLFQTGGRLEKLYHELIYKSEEAKIQLSTTEVVEVEFEVEDDTGELLDCVIPVTRSAFNTVVFEKTESTFDLLKGLLERNGLSKSDIQHVVLVGGSTYIPLVRERLASVLGIPVQMKIDPTTAVAVGAAFYAGQKSRTAADEVASTQSQAVASTTANGVIIRSSYQKTSQSDAEYFTAAMEGSIVGMTYRITRSDGGFDSGQKAALPRISEMLPLLPNVLNRFEFRFFDAQQNPVAIPMEPVAILHGKFNLHGQSLPHDICVEIDDFDNNTTRLEVVFEKNTLLPLRKTIRRTISRNLEKGSSESLIINILEGSRHANPASCLSLGVVEISAANIPFSLVKGSDVELSFKLTESRDLSVQTYLSMTSQEFDNTFNPSERYVLVEKLQTELRDLLREARRELSRLNDSENFELSAKLSPIVQSLEDVISQLRSSKDGELGDLKYQIEEQKRRLAQHLDQIMSHSKSEGLRTSYFDERGDCQMVVYASGNPGFIKRFEEILMGERELLEQGELRQIKSKIENLRSLSWEVRRQDPSYLASLFHFLLMKENSEFSDSNRAEKLKEIGQAALARQNYAELLSVIHHLFGLLPQQSKADQDKFSGFTGLG